MSRPIKHFAYRLGDKLGLDVEVVMSWPVGKIYEYMAFYMTQNDEWLEKYKEEQLTPEERTAKIMQFLASGAKR